MAVTEPTVFSIDDDEAMLDALTTMAETTGLSVETFASAQDFLDRYDPSRPGCLVLDLRMPGMNGLELLGEMKVREIHLPVIFISGYQDVSLVVRAMKAGAVEFLEKPFKGQDLLDRIHAAFEIDAQRRRRRDRRQAYEKRYQRLTPCERKLMQLLVRGMAGEEMTAELAISEKTMEKRRAAVMQKMEAASVAELVLIAVRLGILSADTAAP